MESFEFEGRFGSIEAHTDGPTSGWTHRAFHALFGTGTFFTVQHHTGSRDRRTFNKNRFLSRRGLVPFATESSSL